MKKRMFAALLALCLVLSLGAGAMADGEELNDYQLTGPEMAALGETLSGCDAMTVDNAFFHIIMTYEQTSKGQAYTYAEAIADVLAAEGNDALSAMFGIGDEAELEAVTAIAGWLEEQQMDEERAAGFFQSLSDGMNWPTDAYEAFSEELFPTEADPDAPIEFDVDPANTDENGAVIGTATVPADGYYLFTADASPLVGELPISFTTDLPIQMETDVVPDGIYSEKWSWYELRAAIEVTAGNYTVAVSDAIYDAELIPAQTVDSLEGEFDEGGVYVCALDEPVTVTFTMDANEVKNAYFYGGDGSGLLQILTPQADGGTLTVDFPAGVAVIDAKYVFSSVTGAVS